MADKTGIEWTDATWNPIVGCSIISKGCTNCYAMRVAHRMEAIADASWDGSVPHQYRALTKPSKAGPVWTGRINLAPHHILTQPLRWTRPRRIFVNSMSDLFHENVSDEWIDIIFAVMALTPWHTYQILTKRPERMRDYIHAVVYNEPCRINEHIADLAGDDKIDSWSPPLPNVWLGVSVEDKETAEERIPPLLNTPAAIRFVSCEPLLESVDLERICLVAQKPGSERAGIHINALEGKYLESGCSYTGDWTIDTGLDEKPPLKLDWVIAGGESGPDARPMHPDWVRVLRDQCADAGVPFLFKQWGEWAPGENCGGPPTRTEKTATYYGGETPWCFGTITPRESEQMHRDDEPTLYRIGKRKAGRRLDGKIHDAYPEKKI